MTRNSLNTLIIFLLLLCLPMQSQGYSVLSHEAVVDVCWEKSIRPLLLKRFPGTDEQHLKEAHAYAYGGCVAPDMGYYPFGSKEFTDLVHYVRTGDFVNNLIREARDVNEYAFALGVLCHYHADKYGHPMGVNRSVPIVYPEIGEKYGSEVTYEQDPVAHVRIEFGFDVIQTARGNYAGEQYHNFIDFKISRPVLERAFLETYGVGIGDMFKDFSRSEATFRWIIKDFFPVLTRAAWSSRRAEIKKSNPTMTRRHFSYKMKRANYYHEYGKKREKPGFFASIMGVVIRVLPKVGVLRDLKIKVPGPEAEVLFIRSFDTVTARYSASVDKLSKNASYQFANIDFDTGHETEPGEYGLADKNYIALLLLLKKDDFKHVDESLRRDILSYYKSCNERMAAMAGLQQWNEVTIALDQLKLAKLN